MKPTKLCILFCVLLTLTLPLLGQTPPTQTSVKPSQLSGEPLAAGSVFVVLPSGLVAQADFGPGLSLVLSASGGRPQLVVTIPSVTLPTFIIGERPTSSGPLSYALANDPVVGSVKVYRNGIRQYSPGDYTLAGRVLTFVSAYASDPSPTILCDYTKAP